MTPIIGAFATFIRAERGDLGAWIKRKVPPFLPFTESHQVWRRFRNRVQELRNAEGKTLEETFDHDLEHKA